MDKGSKSQSPAQADPAAEPDMNEAPYSVNVFTRNPGGFEMRFTLRAMSEAALFQRVESLIGRLLQSGYEPSGRGVDRREGGSALARAPEPQSPLPMAEPLFDDAWTGGEMEAELPQESASWCPIHNLEMRRYERNGEVWYSHKAQGDRGEYWCKGKPPKGSK
ncbi:MAG: hypothetical protein WCF84_09395 [Anaerolineae bacterium]